MREIIIDPDLDERHKEGYYFDKMYCSNCDRPNGLYDGHVDVMVKLGKEKKRLGKFVCPNCECKTLNF